MTDIGVGLIGYGLGGRAFHAPYIVNTPGMSLRAVVSSNAAKVHADWPDIQVVPDVAALLAHEDLDLVVVASPDEYHATHAITVLQAGKHVVVDKPFATSLTDAREIVATAARHERLLTVFHNRRWDADFLTLQRLIACGDLGRIVQFESHFDRWRPIPAAVWKEARSGGSWSDLGPHLIDQALCLFGMPQTISLHLATLRDGAPAPDYFHATLGYDGLQVILHSSKLAAEHGLRFAVHGTKGSWIKHGLDVQEAATINGTPPAGADWGRDPIEGVYTPGDDLGAPRAIANENGDYRRFWQGLVAAIRSQGSPPVSTDQALAVMEVLDAGLRSADLGKTIVL